MNHLMIDLETMGTNPDVPIVAIGAAFFEPRSGEFGEMFACTVSLESAMQAGSRPDGDTILFWLGQSEAARQAICGKAAKPLKLNDALNAFSTFISRNCENPKYLKVWGNGASFDNVILRRSYELTGLKCPWHFSGDSDVRTMVMLGRQLGFDPKRDLPFTGERHTAMADAIHQAQYVSAIWQRLIPFHVSEGN